VAAPLNAFDRWRYRRWEQRVLRQPTEVVAVSNHDAELIEQISGRPVNVVVNGVDCDYYQAVRPACTASACCSSATSSTAPTSRPSSGPWKTSCRRCG
jgi:glycosyltransferase involved in cell wall biosynthesis